MPDLLVVILHVKNPVLVHSSVLLNLAGKHPLFFHVLASSGQQLLKTHSLIRIESKFNCRFDLVIDLEIQRKHKEMNCLVMTSTKIYPRFV